MRRKSTICDYFISSVSAITETGEIVILIYLLYLLLIIPRLFVIEVVVELDLLFMDLLMSFLLLVLIKLYPIMRML